MPINENFITQGVVDVINERKRQELQEGWTDLHDDALDDGVLAGAGASYAMNAASQLHPQTQLPLDEIPPWWQLSRSWWKPKSPREDLVKAAALIIAEIDKIDRSGASDHEAGLIKSFIGDFLETKYPDNPQIDVSLSEAYTALTEFCKNHSSAYIPSMTTFRYWLVARNIKCLRRGGIMRLCGKVLRKKAKGREHHG